MKIDTPQIEKTIELEHATDTTIARSSAGQVTVEGAPVVIEGYTTTATAAGTTTLTVASTRQQFFTGTSTQTVTLPVTSTLVLGQTFLVRNLSTGIVTVNSSGANVVLAIPSLTTAIFTCILTSGTTAASWSVSSYLNTPSAGSAGFTSKSRAYISSAQSPSANTLTVVNFGAENYDVDSEFNLTDDRFVATTTGYYLVTSQIYFTGLADQNDYSVYIYKNGAVYAQKLQTSSGTNGMIVNIVDIVPLTATDYVEIRVRRQNAGAIEVGSEWSFVSIHRLS